MKTISAAALFILFLLSVANAAKEPVLDTDGEPLRSDVEYYIVSTIGGAGGGGLDLASSSEMLCPKFVIQQRFSNGRPVFFHPVDTNDPVVYVSTDVNIRFIGIDALCRAVPTWSVGNYDPSAGQWWITTGGDVGNPGPQTLSNWFKIEKAGSGYRLRFCPSVCDSCVSLCNEIDRFPYDGKVRLGLTNGKGWRFFFVKAPKAIKQVVDNQ
ncbi:21 kDa seed protein [Hibiscus syriacus]|uniref:21 kDa seed protein n=1 Tax=Hibiscus syriacus TaxID=106335 RepID=A0A6A2WTC2_HIBSY|nr:21 kDa seed protein-like [Hibiscus syriacus]KAE8663961.1 21 kDa seed protein [Hibiscus syriacus]